MKMLQSLSTLWTLSLCIIATRAAEAADFIFAGSTEPPEYGKFLVTTLKHFRTSHGADDPTSSVEFLEQTCKNAMRFLLSNIDVDQTALEMLDLRIIASRVAEREFFRLLNTNGDANILKRLAMVALCAGTESCATLTDLVRVDLRPEFYQMLRNKFASDTDDCRSLVAAIDKDVVEGKKSQEVIARIAALPDCFVAPDAVVVKAALCPPNDHPTLRSDMLAEREARFERLFGLLLDLTKHIETMVTLGKVIPSYGQMEEILKYIRWELMGDDSDSDAIQLNLRIAAQMSIVNQWHSEIVEHMFHRISIGKDECLNWALTAFRGPVDLASFNHMIHRVGVIPSDLVRWDYSSQFLTAMKDAQLALQPPALHRLTKANMPGLVAFVEKHRSVPPLGMGRTRLVRRDPGFFYYFVMRWGYALKAVW